MCKILEDMRNEVAERVERETTERVTREVTKETASKLLRSIGLSYEQVAECVNLSSGEVKELAKTLGV